MELDKLKVGSKVTYKGQVFTLVEIKHDGGWVPYVFRSKTHELKYPALRLANDLEAGTIKICGDTTQS